MINSSQAYEANEHDVLDYRLPKTVVPTNYEIILTPELQNDFTFKGIVHISAYLRNSTNTVTLHHGRMDITLVTVMVGAQNEKINNTTYDNKTEKYEIRLDKVLKAGTNIMINFEYVGKLRDDMIGFYRSSYVDAKGQIRWLAATQFQTTHARHAFPCFDEPSFKATYDIRILRPAEYSCLSNMPLNRSIPLEDKYWDEFERSIPMSTYLVAFIISDFSHKKVDDFKVWAKPNAVDQTTYALNVGRKGLDYLSKRFKQSYQLPKMDMVAVPDFSAGAMENWGLVTYRESRLLHDENSSSDAAKQSIASVIIHELTHMWFGNMITPEWWGYLWLSEGFARYFQYFATAQIETTWNMEDQFLVEQHQTALAADGVESSLPMTRTVVNSSQIGGVGDTITYNKGASILRMINLVYGANVFDATLQNYLANNAEEKVARPINFWKELENECKRKNQQLCTQVGEIMATWTEQAGFPVVSVTIDNGKVLLEQQRFLLRNLKSTPTNLTWWLPITWTTQRNPNFNQLNVSWINGQRNSSINIDKTPGWVIFNVQSAGFYRVNYDIASWRRIFNTLNSDKYQSIHVLNRAALVDDLLNLARADLLDYSTALDGLRYLTRERDYLPFKAAFSALTYLDQRLSGENEYYKQFKQFVLILIENVYKDIGYVDRPSDDRLIVLLRGELNKWACNYGHETCVQTFTEMFQRWTKYNSTIKPNQRPVAYCMGVRYGTKEDWEFLWREYYKSNSATEQVVILEALGCTPNKTLLERHLLNALKNFEENRIRLQDHTAVFSAVYGSNIFGAEFVLDFVAKYHAEMVKFYNGTGTISSILSSASRRFSTVSLVDKYDSLIKNRKTEFKDIADSLNSSLELARYELQWLKRHTKAITSWVNDFNNEQLNNTISYRLPTSITPNSYNISINTNLTELDNFTFTGSVDIDAIVMSRTKTITLHSVDLIHQNIRLYANDKVIPIAETNIHEKYDFLVIHLSEEVQVGQRLSISIEFTGHMNEEEMRGLYRSWYIDNNGKKRWLAATHMEPVGARKMFPCFDEPAIKANFTMNVLIPQEYNATSNMPIKSSSSNKNTRSITFEETPKMSTYLVALVISDFTSVKEGIYEVLVRQNAIENGKFALSIMKPLVSYFEGILHIPYQLPKLDMVALPDFVSGAMENWGLLTYKERNLLFDRELSTAASKQSIANVIAHEIAHQWFGNLVSPKWWKYLWLNEGFARYFQYFAMHPENTKWSVEGQFVVEQVHSALEVDSSASTHPMTHDVWSPTQIRGIFDTISYGKAASVIRMMENMLGTKSFHEALEIYLRKRKYDVATPEDLFDAISEKIEDEEIKNSIPDIMNSWTIQSGYPVVQAIQNGNHLVLSQQRFFLDPEDSSTESWHIPITWTNLNESNFSDTKTKHWFKRDQREIRITLPTSDLYLLNVRQAGFYRVNYSLDSWQKIIRILNSDRYRTIGEINRATIIDDLFNLARVKHVHYSTLLRATEYLVKENEYLPWRAFFNGLSYLQKQFEGKEGYKAFVRYVSSLLTPIYENLQFEDKGNSTHVELLFRSHVRRWACKLDILDCKSKALDHFSPNIRSVAYCAVAEQNDRKSWDRLWELYERSTFSAEKLTILQSLACTTENAFLKELLHNALSKDKVRFEDSSSVFTSVINSGPKGVEFVMNFVEENYDKMLAHFKQSSNINSIVNTIGKNVFTKKLLDKYVKLLNFLEERKVTKEAKAYKSQAEKQLKWGEENIPYIFHWMEKHYPSTDYRLPNAFTPSRYNLTLSPHFDNFTFTGRVQIEMTRNVDHVSHIVLHASDLSITGLSLRAKNSNLDDKNDVMDRLSNNKTQMITIFMEKFIQSDEFVLDITFAGILNDNMAGFYRSYYPDEEGRIHWLATTQFQPTHARRAFPCFDEPAFKAKFTISVERPDNYQVLSNMDRDKSIPSNSSGRTIDVFRESVEMSTYLVAFIVSEFKSLEVDNNVGIWGRPSIVEKGSRAKNIATFVRDQLKSETGHTYILPKLDLIGIPDMGDMGAMENWGLITFREYGLFYDENVTSTRQLDYIITIIAHELAHSMFGNLVTCDWWEYIWLNEGFAQYMQWYLGALYEPNYGYEELFVVNELQAAMQDDASSTSHPMNNPVTASVIRMLRKSLKSETFKMAVTTYLENNKFGTAKPDDLWQAFAYAINETNDLQREPRNVSYFMSGWTNKPGYPVVSATMLDNGTIILSQKSFSTYEDIEDFWIPITMTTATEQNFSSTAVKRWLQGYYDTISISSQEEWFILNIQQSGYYRVNYDAKSWERLIKALNSNHTLIDVTNRAQIVDDLLNLARAGWVDYTIALKGMTYLSKELNHIPWKAFFNGMSFLLQRYQGQKGEDLLKKYILLLAANVYEELGFDDVKEKSHLDKLNRELILSWICKLNHSECVETSKRIIPPDAKVAIYCTAIRDGDLNDWNFLWEQYLKTNFASEKKIILDALGCSKDEKILHDYIEKALVSNYTADIRKQDFNAVLASIYNSGEYGVDTMLDYIVINYDRLYKYYGNWNDVGALISKLASRFSKEQQIAQLKTLSTKEGGITNIAASINKGIASAQENLLWYQNYSDTINSCLNETIRNIEDKNPASTVVANNLAVALMTVFSLIVYIIN
ncbi:LOW QUALITY PROTEIN: hypothetical protein E2986_13349 [Frieseomelitta varia]|uniref:Aminopeptidase N n=1 Tax=Frieseomelitta varia TaxID=561572 RepID=A0A833S7X2_9HYME|nr:LOW QUALITY PROTEIN: hypothetical protein E2986_13349 [Frieseomelitta varia]